MDKINTSYAFLKFKELCDLHGLTPYKVAQKSEGRISTAALTQWKNNEYQFKLEKLQVIADVFGISVKEFIE